MLLVFCLKLFAEELDFDWFSDTIEQEEELNQDIFEVKYQKKDARLAMVMSAFFPGSGQFYANKKALTAYLFPLIEAGLIAGYIHYDKAGDKKTRAYERYATDEDISYTLPNGDVINTKRYDRERQHRVEDELIGIGTVNIYNRTYFRLDDENTQHFYEDIGKYPHYVFGWADWYYRFAADENGDYVVPMWDPMPDPVNPEWRWEATYPYGADPNLTQPIPYDDIDSSPMRKEYIRMRNISKKDYAKAEIFTFGLAFNHIFAGLDAVRVANKVNSRAIVERKPSFGYYIDYRNHKPTPTLSFNWNF